MATSPAVKQPNRSAKLPTLTGIELDSTRLSDLFFNHQHDHYDYLLKTESGASAARLFGALVLDADELLTLLVGIGDRSLALELALDFMERR